MVQTYAPSAEPFKSHDPVGGALISTLRWELRDETGALADLQGEHWQCTGVLGWTENERQN